MAARPFNTVFNFTPPPPRRREGSASGFRGEDALVVGEDVVHREEDGLAAAPKHLDEELARVKRVGEGDREQQEDASAVTNLVDGVHPRRAPWEVGIAGSEEGAGEFDGTPPP